MSCDWLEKHLGDDNLAVVEVDVNTREYEERHITGAVAWGWGTHLSNKGRRDILGLHEFEKLLGSSGISNNTTVVFYGSDVWYATRAFWQLRIYGHQDVRILNGGRKKWIAEGRKLVKDVAKTRLAPYRSTALNQDLRALLPQVKAAVKGKASALVDVRTPEEFTGEWLVPPGAPETCQRGGHIPGARCIPWALTCNDDGTFKSAEELRTLYDEKGVTPDKEIIAYGRVGDRSSHSWFVLKHLLGYPNVRNYDGSWAEWGNLVGVPIETGEERSETIRRE